MSIGKRKFEKNDRLVDEAPQNIPKISKIIFDEKTGTITLKLASEEEIAQAEKEKGPA
jgi:hypothetical protein